MTQRWFIPLMLVFSALTLAGCSMFRSAPQRELLLTVDDAGYSHDTLEARAGELVKLRLNNAGGLEHHFAIVEIPIVTSGGGMGDMSGMNMAGMSHDMSEMGPMPQLHLVAAAGASNTLEFTPTKSGQYLFECIVPGHTEVGTLFVRGPQG
jgi:uncharacterized cupredoxin-like copper-binding protein